MAAIHMAAITTLEAIAPLSDNLRESIADAKAQHRAHSEAIEQVMEAAADTSKGAPADVEAMENYLSDPEYAYWRFSEERADWTNLRESLATIIDAAKAVAAQVTALRNHHAHRAEILAAAARVQSALKAATLTPSTQASAE